MRCVFETQGITRQFGGLTAVDHVDLKPGAGDLQCIIGSNGCGKTTLFNLITGHYKPSSGKVFISNQDITAKLIREISIPTGITIPVIEHDIHFGGTSQSNRETLSGEQQNRPYRPQYLRF